MTTFVDPRTNPDPRGGRPPARATTEPNELADLHGLCRERRLYDVERWIRERRPMQLAEGTPIRRRRQSSALEIALEDGNHALVLLLLCNGYDPNLEPHCPLDLALRARRWDLLDLLLQWGADPHRVDLGELFDTYNSDLLRRFRAFGVDLTAGHALARALAYHTSNKPLFGFAKRHREHDPKIQAELNIALGYHVEEGSEKGVQLCLWAGADPHAPAADLRYPETHEEKDGEVGEGNRFLGFSAIWRACLRGNAEILERLGPDPSRDDFEDLYGAARSSAVIDLLARHALPQDVGALIHRHLWGLTIHVREWESLRTLRRIFELGVRWEESSAEAIAGIRAYLLKTSDESFVKVMQLFAEGDHCSPDILKELARTPSMRARMQKVGFLPSSPEDSRGFHWSRPSRSREVLSKCGIEIPKQKQSLPRCVEIGTWHRDGQEIRMDRAELFKRVWSQPVAQIAAEWGLSGPGLRKACVRLQIPVPPRGFWAKSAAGKRVRRPRLPTLRPGEAEEIVIWAAQ